MRFLAIFLISTLVAACASASAPPKDKNFYFDGPGSKAEFLRVRYSCYRENLVKFDNGQAKVNEVGGKANRQAGETCSISGFRSCIAANGYRRLTHAEKLSAKFVINEFEKITCLAR